MLPDFIDVTLSNLRHLFYIVPAIILLYASVVVVGGNEIALIERRWFGKKMPQRPRCCPRQRGRHPGTHPLARACTS